MIKFASALRTKRVPLSSGGCRNGDMSKAHAIRPAMGSLTTRHVQVVMFIWKQGRISG
ncbi:hypothetical protein ASAP_1876 [Asaia bogorensis]|uniref:Uncharacterized protein n=1 Tax=Asaia bogorensis TaxID=91915 RepID=A0A060QKI1_9PROT|nr:hypothetical protein ASAP_1876 [Asaia bogorensis]